MRGQCSHRSVGGVVSVLVVAFALMGAGVARAQGSGSGQPSGGPGFWFGAPSGFFRIHTSAVFAGTGSDIYDFLDEQFTLDSGAFNTAGVGTEVGVAVGSRAELLFGVDYNQVTNRTEYRDFVGSDGLPILQSTRLRQSNVTGSVRFPLIRRGRPISTLAWIPNVVTPYVGGGGGAMWYELVQDGEFVDFVDSSIFQSYFRSSGWTPSAHVFGGADINMWKRLFLALEARYVWASADLGGDFVGFEPMDLSGLKLTVGVNVAF